MRSLAGGVDESCGPVDDVPATIGVTPRFGAYDVDHHTGLWLPVAAVVDVVGAGRMAACT
ncbi:hypothetical protein O982_23830 [Mycobacterium avium 10-5581]|nr:hypothetical protein O982_23830 [Mycobacterium avium 10-5581]